jgi:hypothetical protein
VGQHIGRIERRDRDSTGRIEQDDGRTQIQGGRRLINPSWVRLGNSASEYHPGSVRQEGGARETTIPL